MKLFQCIGVAQLVMLVVFFILKRAGLIDWLARSRVRAVRHAYHNGYSWAISALHRGEDLSPHYPRVDMTQTPTLQAFDRGVADAMRDFNTIDADAMWAKAKQRVI